MHTQNNWKIGLCLSLLVVFFWSTLPVALKISLQVTDAWSLTWIRFLSAAVISTLAIIYTHSWKSLKTLSLHNWLWLLLAGMMLIANYIAFQTGLEKTTPANAQVLIQLAPLLMIIGGVVIYKETFYNKQKIGALLLVTGLALFFNDQIQTLTKTEYTSGALMIVFAAITWAIYALIQKKLQAVLSPQVILTVIYLIASISLLPFVQFYDKNSVSSFQWWAIAYTCLNTIGAYGAFAQALKYWQASRVGMVIAMVPVFTLLFVNLMSQLLPDLIDKEQVNNIGFIGVLLIVSGSFIASIGKK